MNKFKKRILIDLDGVLNKYNGNYDDNNIPDIRDGAIEFLQNLSENAELYLFTTRNILLSEKWLIENKIDKYFKDITNVKIPAFLYIDDRCICFRGNYKNILSEIEKFQVYWK